MASKKDSKGNALKKGERQENNGYLFRKQINGKQITIFAKTLPELRAKEKRLERDAAEGIRTSDAACLTLNNLFSEYTELKRGLRDSTLHAYKGLWFGMIAERPIASIRLTDLKQSHLQRLFNDLEREGYAKKTIAKVRLLLSSVMGFAIENDLMRRNLCKGTEIGGEVKEREALTQEQEDALLEFVKASGVYNIHYGWLVLALESGLRVSELCGLRWSDISDDAISVERQLMYKNRGAGYCEWYVEKTKTAAGVRKVPLTPKARAALQEWRKYCMLLGWRCGMEVDGLGDWVFFSKTGTPLDVTKINTFLRNIVKAMNKHGIEFPHISAHILRHSFATRCFENDISPKVAQVVLGHKDISTTLNIYTHADETHIKQEFAEKWRKEA